MKKEKADMILGDSEILAESFSERSKSIEHEDRLRSNFVEFKENEKIQKSTKNKENKI